MLQLGRFYNSIISKSKTITVLVALFATCGTFTVLLGGVWDASSHELRVPETFWTIQHMTIYSGASLVTISAALGLLVLIQTNNRSLRRGMLMIIVGAILQLAGGYADYNFHEIFGIDGLVTPSHLTVETGLLLSSLGGLTILSRIRNVVIRRFFPISIMVVLLSASWIGFNMVLLIGAVVLCVPVYQLFSSGCAIM